MSGVVLHIGLPKTGTTTLQKAVFPHLPGVAYAGKRIPGYGFATQPLGEAVAATISADSALADPAPALAAAVAELRAQCGAGTLVLSTESLAHPAARDLGLVADRLARAVPDARILITLRAQPALALSWYRSHGRFAQYLFTHKTEAERIPAQLMQRDWWRLVAREPRGGLLAALDFDALVGCYERRFGGRVTVLPLELLAADRAAYAARLAGALEVPASACAPLLANAHENRGLSAREVAAARLLGRVGLRTDFLEHRGRSALRRWLAGGPSADPALDPAIADDLRARFAAGNRRLAERIPDLRLAALGYDLSARGDGIA
jgi:hypothetical protein